MNQICTIDYRRSHFRPMGMTLLHSGLGGGEEDRRSTCSLLLVLTGVLLFLGGIYLTIWAHRSFSEDRTHNLSVVGPIITITGVLTLATSVHYFRTLQRANRERTTTRNFDPEVISGPVLFNSAPRTPDVTESPPSYDQCIEKPPPYSSLQVTPVPSTNLGFESEIPAQVHKAGNPTRY